MKSSGPDTRVRLEPQEYRRRRRELLTLVLLGLLFLVLTWIEFRLFEMSRSLPYVHSIFFFGLVNFNIILFLLMMFLVFRNVVKNFAERQGGVIGSSLKSKLIAAFVGFSFVPTALMFLVSVFYINNSFDKWFSEKMSGVLKSSLEVTNAYYVSAKKKNYHFAEEIKRKLIDAGPSDLGAQLKNAQLQYSVDAVEYYTGLFGPRSLALSNEVNLSGLPPISLELRKKGVIEKLETSTIHHFGAGNLIRVIIPHKLNQREQGAIVVSSFVPLSLISKMDDIATAYEEFRDIDPLAYPLKSIYLIVLVLMTLVILLAATWFGFYLAKHLSVPLEELAQATRKIAKGKYPTVKKFTGTPEINQLVLNFNTMTRHLERTEKEVKRVTNSLRKTLAQLDEHSKYIEVVLSNVNTGVISMNKKGVITMVNNHASKLLGIKPEKSEGKLAKDVLKKEFYSLFSELLKLMKSHNVESLQKEAHINTNGRSIPIQMTLSFLYDDNGREMGKILVFDDLTMVLNAQRAAAWTEVARRIAHEIKNPLTPIKLSAQRLNRKFGEDINDPAFGESVSMIIKQTDDLKALVNEFSRFARMPESKPAKGDLHDVIEESLVLYREAHKNIQFVCSLDYKLPPFMFDSDQIKRLLTNLLDNAVAAISGQAHAKVEIKTKFDPLLNIVSLSIVDNGPGIPDELRDRIFEPYMTTKQHGTGLGLAIVKRTVEDHNGYIRAFANSPTGTQFVIELPVIMADNKRESKMKNKLIGDESQSTTTEGTLS